MQGVEQEVRVDLCFEVVKFGVQFFVFQGFLFFCQFKLVDCEFKQGNEEYKGSYILNYVDDLVEGLGGVIGVVEYVIQVLSF